MILSEENTTTSVWMVSNTTIESHELERDETTTMSDAATLFVEFERNYREVHGYAASIVCIFGIISNLCNVYVLTRKNMRNNSTNVLLTSIAVFDLLTELFYLPFTIHFHILTDTSYLYKHPVAWIYYAIISVHSSVVCHTIAMWLTVALAAFRYICVSKHIEAQTLCTPRRAYLTIVLVIVASVLLSMPILICQRVVDVPVGNTTHPWMDTTVWCQKHDKTIATFNFLIFGGVVKTSACAILLFFTMALIASLGQVSLPPLPKILL